MSKHIQTKMDTIQLIKPIVFLFNFHFYFLIFIYIFWSNYKYTETNSVTSTTKHEYQSTLNEIAKYELGKVKLNQSREQNKTESSSSSSFLVITKYQSSAALFSIRVSSARNITEKRNHYHLPSPPSQNKNELGL